MNELNDPVFFSMQVGCALAFAVAGFLWTRSAIRRLRLRRRDRDRREMLDHLRQTGRMN
jgi:uncharacterized membrane protein YccC